MLKISSYEAFLNLQLFVWKKATNFIHQVISSHLWHIINLNNAFLTMENLIIFLVCKLKTFSTDMEYFKQRKSRFVCLIFFIFIILIFPFYASLVGNTERVSQFIHANIELLFNSNLFRKHCLKHSNILHTWKQLYFIIGVL